MRVGQQGAEVRLQPGPGGRSPAAFPTQRLGRSADAAHFAAPDQGFHVVVGSLF